MYRLAYRYSKEIIFYFDSAGNKYVASGGNLAWRINNPGLLHSRSHFSRKYGSIRSCGSYAIFSSPRDGRKALSAWLQSKKYYNSTLKTIATHYQQSTPNKFLSRLSDLSKILPTTKINSLSTLEFDHLLICIEKLCDFSSIGNESLLLLPKIIAKIENGVNEDTYLIEDNTIISKEKAIELVLAHRLDAVIVHALELLHPEERELLRIFTFGGGTFILPGKSHPESHNYASAADHVCLGSALNDQSLALKRYYGLRAGHTEQQVINQLAYDDTILCLDSIDPQTISLHRELYVKYYKKEFARIRHITILDPDPGNRWKHEFASECYQSTVRDIIRIYQKL